MGATSWFDDTVGAAYKELTGQTDKEERDANQRKADAYKEEMYANLPEAKQLAVQQAIAQGYDADKVLSNAFDQMAAEDPRFRQIQMQALEQMSNWSKGKQTEADLQNQNQMQRANAMEERAQREAMDQRFAARGAAPSSTALYGAAVANMANSSNRNAQQGQQQLGDIQNRAFSAVGQASGMAGQARAFEDSQQARKASAANSIAMLNAEATNRSRQFSADATNRVNMFNADANNAMTQYNDKSRITVAGMKNQAAQAGYEADQGVQQQFQAAQAQNDARWAVGAQLLGGVIAGPIGSAIGGGIAGLFQTGK